MYHIVNAARKQFQVVAVGVNSEPLNSSELLKSKQKAFQNIQAVLSATVIDTPEDVVIYVQDDTLRYPKVFEVTYNDRIVSVTPAVPKYIPGKNPKRKRK